MTRLFPFAVLAWVVLGGVLAVRCVSGVFDFGAFPGNVAGALLLTIVWMLLDIYLVLPAWKRWKKANGVDS